MEQIQINVLAVLVAAIVSMVIGSLWYSPLLFGNIWMRLSGITISDVDKAKQRGMGKTYVIGFIGSLVMSYVLAHSIAFAGGVTFAHGMAGGFWNWLGFIVPVILGSVLWENRPVGLFFINIGYYLVALVLMGGILALWR